MTIAQKLKDEARELRIRRQIWRAFFLLTEPIDPESLLVLLKATGLMIERVQVYSTMTLLIDYGFADRNRNEELGITYYQCR